MVEINGDEVDEGGGGEGLLPIGVHRALLENGVEKPWRPNTPQWEVSLVGVEGVGQDKKLTDWLYCSLPNKETGAKGGIWRVKQLLGAIGKLPKGKQNVEAGVVKGCIVGVLVADDKYVDRDTGETKNKRKVVRYFSEKMVDQERAKWIDQNPDLAKRQAEQAKSAPPPALNVPDDQVPFSFLIALAGTALGSGLLA